MRFCIWDALDGVESENLGKGGGNSNGGRSLGSRRNSAMG